MVKKAIFKKEFVFFNSMSIKSYVARKADNVGAAVSALSGGLLLGQFPEFFAEYMQRLGGHIDEATRTAETYHIPQAAERAQKLHQGLEALTNAHFPWRLWEFVKHVDRRIAHRTLENYIPGMTFDSEGLGYCAIGAVAGLVAYEVGKAAVSRFYRRRHQPEPVQPARVA